MPQLLSNLLVHLVFSTKHRENTIKPKIETELYAYLASIHKAMRCPLLKIGGTDNHLHILCRLERTVTLSKLVEELKTSSSKWMKQKTDNPTFAWQQGYGAFSIGASNIDALSDYIAKQKQHHQPRSFEDEFRLLLKKYHITWDEAYVWD